MKAADILQQYQNGQRNFQRLNLRGLNFTGKDLSGADFSHCQIQGANFKQATLTGANFTRAKAGLQKRWIFVLTVRLCLLAAFPQYFLFQTLKFPVLPISNQNQFINIVIIIIILVIYGYSFIKHSLSEKISIIVAAYILLGTVATGFALFEIRVTNLETYTILGLSVFAITLVAAICMGTFWLIYERWIIYILPLILATVGLIEGYLASKETKFAMIIGIFISLIGWIIGSITGYLGVQENENHRWVRPIILLIISCFGTNFKNANLTNANFTSATLKNTNFNQAILTRTCFTNTVKLNLARAGNTILANPTVRELLINPSNGCEINLFKADLRGANLESANLEKANLSQADISEATLQYANLKDANLTEVNGVKTNFSHTLLTGACLENWNIDATTILENVECQYVYLLNNKQERRPSSGNFQGNEFTKLFEEVFDTVDLIFRDGVDWKAFLLSMKEIQVQNEETPLEVQSIENKGDGVVIVKVKVPPEADKEKIHQEFNEVYQLKLAAIEAKYKGELNAKDVEIQSYRRENGNMQRTIEILANRTTINVSNSQFDGGFAGRDYDGNVENIMNQLSESKDKNEIKQLLQQLIDKLEQDNEKSS